MTGTELSEDAAEDYVCKLFQFLLGRTTIRPEELSYWSRRVVSGPSPIDIFYEFVNSRECQERVQRDRVSATMYPPGHFYSPAVNTDELRRDLDRVYAPKQLSGIQLNGETQLATLRLISRFFEEMPFTDDASHGLRYYYNNTSYGFGDACVYWGMLGAFRPRRILEIGSGFTSALATDAIAHFGLQTICTFVDPYPELLYNVVGPLAAQHTVFPGPVQEMPLSKLDELSENDFLFIDSSHIVKTGSDVHFELTELLPRLRPGVIVHFHDVFFPFEYPMQWTLTDNKSWNEVYFLHSFLLFNDSFEIVYFNDYIAKMATAALEKHAPLQHARISINPGGGLWLRRR